MRRCIECRGPLTADEVYYYGNRCETCEGEWLRRVEAWRRYRVTDRQLDEVFDDDSFERQRRDATAYH